LVICGKRLIWGTPLCFAIEREVQVSFSPSWRAIHERDTGEGEKWRGIRRKKESEKGGRSHRDAIENKVFQKEGRGELEGITREEKNHGNAAES
jgi:hypothetical protein